MLQKHDGPDLSHVNKISIIYKSEFDSAGKLGVKNTDITEPLKINSIMQLISAEPTKYLYCVSTGVMNLYTDSTFIISIVFNTNDDFRHIAYNYNNKLTALELSSENAKMIESIINQTAVK